MTATITVFGQILTPAGLPAVGVGVTVNALDSDDIAASSVTSGTGLFILRYQRSAIAPVAGAHPATNAEADANAARDQSVRKPHNAEVRLSVNSKAIKSSLPETSGVYGPLRIVAEKAPPPDHAAIAPRPILDVDEATLAAILTTAPELFLTGVKAEQSDPCDALGQPNVASRTYYLNELMRLLPAGPRQKSAASFKELRKSAQQAARDVPHFGVMITYRQDWWDLGRSLGDLLYTLPLAPGEEMKVATVDWRRVDQAKRQSSVDESVAQDTSISRIDTIDDVVTMSSDKSGKTNSDTHSAQGGGGFGLSIGGFGLAASGSTSSSSTVSTMSEAVTASSTNAEAINDQVRQTSNTLRGTRSMSIAEVQESETSNAATRVVRNHNHAHTLTIEYFQVLSHYLLETTPQDFTPVMFVPMPGFEAELPKFSAENLATEYAPTVLRALLEPAFANELRALMAAESPSAKAAPSTGAVNPSSKSSGKVYFAGMVPESNVTVNIGTTIDVDAGAAEAARLRNAGLSIGWVDSAGRHSAAVEFLPVAPGADPRWLIGYADAPAVDFSQPNSPSGHDLTLEVGGEFKHLSVIFQDANGVTAHSLLVDADSTSKNQLVVAPNFALTGTFKEANWPGATSPAPALIETAIKLSPGLLAHLNDNLFYYAGAVMSSLDSSAIYTWIDGLGLSGLLQPKVIGQLGNMLAVPLIDASVLPTTLRGPIKEPPKTKRRVVTLPTPGVFAESMLGACSAAEIIDDTRFWDWVKSPIPEDAPDITGQMLASRYQSMSEITAPTVSNLTPPAVQIPTEPEPFIKVGDATMSELVKDLDFKGDAEKAVAFLQGAAQAAASAAGMAKPGAASSSAGHAAGGGSAAASPAAGAGAETGAGDAAGAAGAGDAGALGATSEIGDVALASDAAMLLA